MLTVEDNTTQTTTIGDISIGETKLIKNTDYTVAGLIVTLLKASLDDLAEGDHIVTIVTNWGNLSATITVEDTTGEG